MVVQYEGDLCWSRNEYFPSILKTFHLLYCKTILQKRKSFQPSLKSDTALFDACSLFGVPVVDTLNIWVLFRLTLKFWTSWVQCDHFVVFSTWSITLLCFSVAGVETLWREWDLNTLVNRLDYSIILIIVIVVIISFVTMRMIKLHSTKSEFCSVVKIWKKRQQRLIIISDYFIDQV